MATFKVGQWVRIVRITSKEDAIYNGVETVITGNRYGGVLGPAYPTSITDAIGRPGVLERCLEPIVDDPSADAFLERLKKLGKEPVIPVHTVPFGD